MNLFVVLLLQWQIVSVLSDSFNSTNMESHIGQVGKIALWIGAVSHSFAALAYVIASKRCKEETQIYYHINIIICSIASTCYFMMAMGQSDYITSGGNLVLWARYVEFLIGTPLLLIDLCMVINIPSTTMFYICFMDILMIGTGWFATIATTSTAKWVLYILGCIFFYPILDVVLGFTPDPNNSTAGHNRFIVIYTAVVWNGYAILWVLHDGFGWISLDSECIIHTILDILAKDLFGVVLLYNHGENSIVPHTEESGTHRIELRTIKRSTTVQTSPYSIGRQSIRRSSRIPLTSPQIVVTSSPLTSEHRRVSHNRNNMLRSDDIDLNTRTYRSVMTQKYDSDYEETPDDDSTPQAGVYPRSANQQAVLARPGP